MKNVEDVYALSPMQEVMLFHACTQPDKDVLINQVCYKISGPLNVETMQAAWQVVLERYAALRTAFLWKGLKQPQQVVRSHLEIPFTQIDWCAHSASEQTRMFEEFRREDRGRGFELQRAPLMRISLLLLDKNSAYMVWSSHHLILDRWCIAILLSDFLASYQAQNEGSELSAVSPVAYKDYISWIQRQNTQTAGEFWSREMAAFQGGTAITLARERQGNNGAEPRQCYRQVPAADLDLLREFCKHHRVTLATLVQGAWALQLNHLTQSQDVVFGLVVSGRPPDLPGAESMVGSFVNNLPMRARLARDASVLEWLLELQSVGYRRVPYEYFSLSQLQSWWQLDVSKTLFDSIIVWLTAIESPSALDLDFAPLPGSLETGYPLTLGVGEREDALEFSLTLGQRHQSCRPLAVMLDGMVAALCGLTHVDSKTQLCDLPGFRGELSMRDQPRELPRKYPRPAMGVGHGSQNSGTLDQSGRVHVKQQVLEDLLQAEWQELLGLEEVAPEADFFDLGGDSLKAASLHRRVELAVRQVIPILALFHDPTLRGMASAIYSGNWPLKSEMVSCIRAGKDLAPLFFIAYPDVSTIGFSIMARHLDSSRPLYVVQALPEMGWVRSPTLEEQVELSARYVTALREIQAEGPYYLLGMCTGSLLAIEIIRLLEEQGQEVSYHGIINSWPRYSLSMLYHIKLAIDYGNYYARRLLGIASMGPRGGIASLREIFRRKLSTQQGKPAAQQKQRAKPTSQSEEGMHGLHTEIRLFGWAHKRPEIVKVRAPTVVYQLEKQEYWRLSEPCMGWGHYAENVCEVQIPGVDNRTVLQEPYVQALALVVESNLCAEAEQDLC